MLCPLLIRNMSTRTKKSLCSSLYFYLKLGSNLCNFLRWKWEKGTKYASSLKKDMKLLTFEENYWIYAMGLQCSLLYPTCFESLYIPYYQKCSIQASKTMSIVWGMVQNVLHTLSSFFAVCPFRASPTAYGGSKARGRIGAAADAGLHHSHSNTRSKALLQPTLHLSAMPDP